jgi:hypothetical protein
MAYTYTILFEKPEDKKRLRETGGCQSTILKRLSNKENWIVFVWIHAISSAIMP